MTTPAPPAANEGFAKLFLGYLAALGKWAIVSKALPNWAVVAVAVGGFLLGRLI